MLDPVSRFRRFARAVTTEIGALDSGLMSRLLRGLEKEGLIVTTSSLDDARRRLVSLTSAGEREFLAYESISNERAELLLDKHGYRDALLSALDLVASALTSDQVEFCVKDPGADSSHYCLEQYYQELADTFEGGFDVTRSRDPTPEQMMAPHGAFLVALSDGLPIGCVGLKGTGNGEAEIKRLWISPAARGQGLAYRLMDKVEVQARKLSITTLRLDTNRALSGAMHLYQRMGWTEIERFNDDPYADFFFERTLA